MKENIRNFNTAAKLFLLIPVFRSLANIFESYSMVSIGNTLGYPTSSYVAEIVFSILVITSIVFTIMRKRYGLIALFTVLILRAFATYPIEGAVPFSYFFGTQVAEFIIGFGLFVIAMFFKKDGISGWASMLASEEYVSANTVRQEEQ